MNIIERPGHVTIVDDTGENNIQWAGDPRTVRVFAGWGPDTVEIEDADATLVHAGPDRDTVEVTGDNVDIFGAEDITINPVGFTTWETWANPAFGPASEDGVIIRLNEEYDGQMRGVHHAGVGISQKLVDMNLKNGHIDVPDEMLFGPGPHLQVEPDSFRFKPTHDGVYLSRFIASDASTDTSITVRPVEHGSPHFTSRPDTDSGWWGMDHYNLPRNAPPELIEESWQRDSLFADGFLFV